MITPLDRLYFMQYTLTKVENFGYATSHEYWHFLTHKSIYIQWYWSRPFSRHSPKQSVISFQNQLFWTSRTRGRQEYFFYFINASFKILLWFLFFQVGWIFYHSPCIWYNVRIFFVITFWEHVREWIYSLGPSSGLNF